VTFEPPQILAEVEAGAAEIEKLTDQLAEAIRADAEAEIAYDEQFEKALLGIYHRAKDSGERMPAEDVRKAVAHDEVDDGIYGAHLMARANLNALDKKLKGCLAATSARQSLLRAMGSA
jgi:hypothetical protein